MRAVQAMGTAGAQALGTEESTACSRNHRDPRARENVAGKEAERQDRGILGESHAICSGFSSLSLEQWEVSGFQCVTLAVVCRTDSRGTWKLDTSWMIATGAQVNKDHSWTRWGR